MRSVELRKEGKRGKKERRRKNKIKFLSHSDHMFRL